MKKVMMVIPSLSVGGAEKMAIDIAAHVDRSLIDVTVVSLYPYRETVLSEYAKKAGLNVIYLNKKSGSILSVVRELKQTIKKIKPDVIHTHLYVAPYVLLAAGRKILKYHTVHNVAEKEATGFLRLMMKWAYKFGGFTPVAISPYCADTFGAVYKRPSNTIPTVINGIDISRFRQVRTEHTIVKLINVGRFNPQKNQKLLIKVFAEIHRQCPNTVLEIVGDGYLRSELEDAVRANKLENVVIMQGESDLISEKLGGSDIFVLSSDYEGLPVSVLEAMASGLPIVTTKAGGVVDIVKDGVNGMIVPVGDIDALTRAVVTLVNDKEKRKSMGEASKKIAEAFSIEECAKKYQELYLR